MTNPAGHGAAADTILLNLPSRPVGHRAPPGVCVGVQLACPAPITGPGVVGAGDMVTYPTATVTGGLPPVVVACNPPSGSTFPAGTTTATCTANDSLGRQTACSFTVTLVAVTLNAQKYLAFGDSVTAGEDGRSLFIRPTFVDPVHSYPAVLQGQLVTSFPRARGENSRTTACHGW